MGSYPKAIFRFNELNYLTKHYEIAELAFPSRYPLATASGSVPSLRILYPFRRGFNLSQQRIDPRGLFFDRVAHEVKRGSMAQIE
jgi:hypothetical protein